jgi:hypothetical protein
MDPQPNRNWNEADLLSLGRECQRVASEIQTARRRTPHERLELAAQAAALLHAAAHRLSPAPNIPHEPEQALTANSEQTITHAYEAWMQILIQRTRHLVVTRAADWVLRERAYPWLSGHIRLQIDPISRYYTSDQSTREMHERLDTLKGLQSGSHA